MLQIPNMDRSLRRYLTGKKAAIRMAVFARFRSAYRPDTLGHYRKAKGCECRRCSLAKQAEKHAATKLRRREIPDSTNPNNMAQQSHILD